jgi:NAD(P)-dependent dehydrogenase (short-subunit alcohol dehydrogenase family)
MTILAGKIAVVTGASRGIGKSIALELADAGAQVACVATRAENAEEIVSEIQYKGGEAIALGCRVEIGTEVTAMFAQLEAKLGPVDILVNNAGVTYPQFTLDMTEENWDLHMNVNAKSIFLCSQAAARQMRLRRAGCIINIGSILGRNAFPATLGYCASKAAVDHMTRVLAIEWAKYGIRVNCIAPGYVRTDLIDRLAEEGKLTLADLERRTPQRRLGSGADIAKAVRYVASDDAGFMTGEVLVIDGGWTAFGYY